MSQLNLNLLRDGVRYVDQWVAYQQDRRDVPGIVVAIQCDEHVLLSKGYGYADLDRQVRMTPQHTFRVASHSKIFTATAIMQLVEQGKVRLDDQLMTYVPWLQLPSDRPGVTVRHVLNHTAGIVRDGDEADYWQLGKEFPDGVELQRLLRDAAMVLATSDCFKYSNIGYALLGSVIEAASGIPYNDYVKSQIVDRLNLLDTGPETDSRAETRYATGYTKRRLGMPRQPMPNIVTHALSPATGFYSTAEDMCRFASAHFLGNTVLLGDAAKREMQQPYWKIEQTDEHYGLGFSVIGVGPRRFVGHGGSFPGYATRTLIDCTDRLAIVVLINELGGPAPALALQIARILDFALHQQVSPNSPHPNYSRFCGRFVNLWGVTDVASFGDNLLALDPEDEDPLTALTTLAVVDERTLRIVGAKGYHSLGEKICYVYDSAERLLKIVIGGKSSYALDVFRSMQLGL